MFLLRIYALTLSQTSSHKVAEQAESPQYL